MNTLRKKNQIILALSFITTLFHCAIAINSYSISSNVVLQKLIKRLEQQNHTFDTTKFEKKWKEKFKKSDTRTAQQAATEFIKALKENPYYQIHSANNSHPFFLGLSSSAYQYEGDIGAESAHHKHYTERNLPLPGKALNFWNNYQTMITEMKNQCHINNFRLSTAWERIQKSAPEPILINFNSIQADGNFDKSALEGYRQKILDLKNNNIEPLIVLNHYTLPQWFVDIGGFEKKENIRFFVNYGKALYEALGDLVQYWSTFNAIEGEAFKGYYISDPAQSGPPAKGESDSFLQKMKNVATVQANMLEAHVQIYEAFKGIPAKGTTGLYQEKLKTNKNIPEPKIGIQKNIIQLDPYQGNIMHRLAGNIQAYIGNKIQNEGFYSFFTTGTFKALPSKITPYYTNKWAPFTLDWIGVNTYSNKLMGAGTIKDEDDRKTDNPNYRFYPEGIDRAVKEVYQRIVEPLNKKTNHIIPIWITENGFPSQNTPEGNERRTLFFKRTLYVIQTLLEQGYPIIGYTPWASHDNFEWGSEYGSKRYGMFYVHFNENGDRGEQHTLKEGSQFFCDFVKDVLEKITPQ